jgi:hypothetical protein
VAQRSPTIAFEDVPLDAARRMSRESRMDPKLYHALKEKIASLDTTATCLTISQGTTPTTEEPHPPGGRRAQDTCDRQKSSGRSPLLALD